jgi:hypothetical protein
MNACRAQAAGTFSFAVDAPVEAVFELVTPEGERRWAPAWNPLYLNATAQEAGTVFETHDHGQHRVWLVDTFDTQRHRIRYIVFHAKNTLTTIDVAVDAKTEHSSSVSVTYRRVSLDPDRDAAVRSFEVKLQHMGEEWAQAFAAAVQARQ